MKFNRWLLFAIAFFSSSFIYAKEEPKLETAGKVFMFSSFRGNGESGLHLSYSLDGLNWQPLQNDTSFVTPQVGGKLMRDPCIIQGPDGLFHMVWTSSWEDRGIGIAHSSDLINWSEQKFIPVMENEPSARNAWAPEIIWDPDQQHYLIYWASTIPGKFPLSEKTADKGWDHRIYSISTTDFTHYSDTTLLYQPGFNVIDSTINKFSKQYVMVLKDETRFPPAKNLRLAFSQKITGPWLTADQSFSPADIWVEGPTLLKVGKWYYLYFDEYTRHQYGGMRTQDFKTWENISHLLHFPKGSRHGSAFTVSKALFNKLVNLHATKSDPSTIEKPKAN